MFSHLDSIIIFIIFEIQTVENQKRDFSLKITYAVFPSIQGFVSNQHCRRFLKNNLLVGSQRKSLCTVFGTSSIYFPDPAFIYLQKICYVSQNGRKIVFSYRWVNYHVSTNIKCLVNQENSEPMSVGIVELDPRTSDSIIFKIFLSVM